MRVHHGIVFTVLAAGACSGDTIPEPEPANFAELCGEVGPVQILALDPDRPLARVASWGTYEGRRVFHVGYLGEGASIAGYPPLGEWETWSVGPCGEDPLLLASGDYLPVYYHQVTADFLPGWPDMPLLCDEATGQISVVDPSGVRPSNVVFETGDCEWREIDDGMLTLVPQDEESAALVLQLWPDDPWTMKAEQVVLHDSVQWPWWRQVGYGPAVTDEDVLVITSMDELVAVSRLDGELTTLATDVREFYHDTSGRYVIWQGTELTNGDPDRPRGPISLLDRQTGEVTQLIVGSLSDTFFDPFTLGELGLLHLWIEADGVERFYRLPTLEFIDVPDHLGVLWLVDDHRALVSHQFPINSPVSLIDALTGELTPLYDGPGNIVRGADTGMFMLDNGPCCADGDDNDGYRKAGALRFVPYDGGAALVARRATYNFVPAADGRVITPVEVGADWTGSLISVGPDTLDEQLIDEDVLIFWPSIDSEIEGDPVIVYAIDHPERQGIWLARLAN